jgi:glutamate-ammonia-ligase adenylyltransferase
MLFSDAITRSPTPFQPDIGAEVAVYFARMPDAFRRLVEGVAGCSPYLAGLLRKEAEWITGLADQTPDAMLQAVLRDVRAAELSAQSGAFRQAKRRVALLAALADLGGVWALGQVTGALTGLADACVDSALKALVAAEIARGKLPGLSAEDAADAGGMAVLAMGKMGAGELNYSSDIDLICLFDETRFDPADYTEARAAFIRVTRKLTALLSEVTPEGYVFRTDLRLRPDASVTPVCIAMETAERYYESVGRTWERAAFIKARVCGGDIAAGQSFLDRLTPFVWRKHLDFAAIQDAHDMRLRIRDHKGLGGAFTLEGHNVKLGQGGIREIEFFTQTRQIIAGGRDRTLRVRGTVEGLDRLVASGWVEAQAASELQANYAYLREVEHRLQMLGDAQTHDLPSAPEGFARLAAFMGTDAHTLRAELTERFAATARLTEDFFAPEASAATDSTLDYLEKWRSLPALRSPRAAEIFQRVFPGIRAHLDAAGDPAQALQAFERFLSGLPAGVQVLSLFEANPQLTQLVADICAASAELAGYLSRNAQVFDAVLGGDFFSPWPGQAGLHAQLAAQLSELGDYEAQLDLARRWQKEWHFRIGVHQLRGLIAPEEAAQQYADLAEAAVGGLFPFVVAQFSVKHGPQPGRGAAVVAMGSLGAAQLSARSDLDLIVVYDAGGAEGSDGPRPLTTRAYFARLTQALVTALSAATAEGKLYEVDMRLRPSGQAGPVATSLQSFESYQCDEAWLWEHMALSRARAVAGDSALVAEFGRVRRSVLTRSRRPEDVAQELDEMRRRLAEAGRTGSTWDVKLGPGGVQDIELFAQGLALLARSDARDTAAQLQSGAALEGMTEQIAGDLASAHRLFGRITQTARLLTLEALQPETLGAGGQAMLLRDGGADSLAELAERLDLCRKQAKSHIDLTLHTLRGGAKSIKTTKAGETDA